MSGFLYKKWLYAIWFKVFIEPALVYYQSYSHMITESFPVTKTTCCLNIMLALMPLFLLMTPFDSESRLKLIHLHIVEISTVLFINLQINFLNNRSLHLNNLYVCYTVKKNFLIVFKRHQPLIAVIYGDWEKVVEAIFHLWKQFMIITYDSFWFRIKFAIDSFSCSLVCYNLTLEIAIRATKLHCIRV